MVTEMSKKDALEKYNQKLQELEQFKEKGAITYKEYHKQRKKIESQKPLSKVAKTGLWIIAGVVILVLTVAIANTPNQPQSNKSEPPKLLDVSIKFNAALIEFKNNQPTELGNCDISINGGDYKGRVTISTQPNSYALNSFSKGNGERFNHLTHKMQRIDISHCSGQPGSTGSYGN